MSLQLMIRYSDGDGGDIIMDGFTASIGNDAERAYAFGFFMGGILLLFWGYAGIDYDRGYFDGGKRLLAPEDVSCGLFPFWHAEWN